MAALAKTPSVRRLCDAVAPMSPRAPAMRRLARCRAARAIGFERAPGLVRGADMPSLHLPDRSLKFLDERLRDTNFREELEVES